MDYRKRFKLTDEPDWYVYSSRGLALLCLLNRIFLVFSPLHKIPINISLDGVKSHGDYAV